MEPSAKSEGMNKLLSKLMGKDRVGTITNNECMTCDRKASDEDGAFEFRTALDRREFSISGMCQVCQDSVFGSDA